jgi:hypothetical protein
MIRDRIEIEALPLRDRLNVWHSYLLDRVGSWNPEGLDLLDERLAPPARGVGAREFSVLEEEQQNAALAVGVIVEAD